MPRLGGMQVKSTSSAGDELNILVMLPHTSGIYITCFDLLSSLLFCYVFDTCHLFFSLRRIERSIKREKGTPRCLIFCMLIPSGGQCQPWIVQLGRFLRTTGLAHSPCVSSLSRGTANISSLCGPQTNYCSMHQCWSGWLTS